MVILNDIDVFEVKRVASNIYKLYFSNGSSGARYLTFCAMHNGRIGEFGSTLTKKQN